MKIKLFACIHPCSELSGTQTDRNASCSQLSYRVRCPGSIHVTISKKPLNTLTKGHGCFSDFTKQQVFTIVSDSSWKPGFTIFKITALIREVENQHNHNISIVTFSIKLGSIRRENFFSQVRYSYKCLQNSKWKAFLKVIEGLRQFVFHKLQGFFQQKVL